MLKIGESGERGTGVGEVDSEGWEDYFEAVLTYRKGVLEAMAYYLYVTVAQEDKISIFEMDGESGGLDKRGDFALAGGPGPMAVTADGRFIYVSRRSSRQLSTLAVDAGSGALSLLGTVEEASDSVYVAVDRKDRFVLTSSNGGGRVAVYRIGDDGTVVAPAVEWVETAPGAHSIQTDPSNRFAYVPHITESNAMHQFMFDEDTGKLTPNEPPRVVPSQMLGPRHFCFHLSQDILYTSDEQGSSVTSYGFDAQGRLTILQTVSTLAEDFDGENYCAQIRLHPTGKFLYAPNRGHESIACFTVDSNSGELAMIGCVPTEAHTRGFNLDPQGKFLFAAGAESGKMAAYDIDQDSGELLPREVHELGAAPMWILIEEM